MGASLFLSLLYSSITILFLCSELAGQAIAADKSQAALFTVTNTRPAGAGSLAEAITRANTITGARIQFQIPNSDPGFDRTLGIWTIRLPAPLPNVSGRNIIIDGTSQPQAGAGRAGPRVVLAAERPGIEQALAVLSDGNTIRGLVVGGFKHGVVLPGAGAASNTIANCFIGLAPGDAPMPNDVGVALVDGARGNTISDCLISGNKSAGVYIGGKNCTGNVLRRNRIGSGAAGQSRRPNGVGILLERASAALIESNLISGNDDIGLLLVGKWTERNVIRGNLVGTDISGTKLLHNDKGIVIKSLANRNILGGNKPSDRNIISGNLEIGIYIEAADCNRITGNFIGTDITGTKAVQENELVQGNGIEFNTVAKNNMLGGTEPGERNIISGHKVYGVVYYGHCASNSTIGNFIGTDVTGTRALPNATGICVDCASHHNDIAHNVISGNLSYGLFFVTRGTEGNTLRGNLIGTDLTGLQALPNDIGMVISTGAARNTVGGMAAGDRNVISGNRQTGVMISNRFTEENTVIGNFIGVDATGTNALGNKHGVLVTTYPKSNYIRANVISGNRSSGVILYEYAEANVVAGNYIGTDMSRRHPLGNGEGGVVVDQHARGNVIGLRSEGNFIMHNKPANILVLPNAGQGNTFQGNEEVLR